MSIKVHETIIPVIDPTQYPIDGPEGSQFRTFTVFDTKDRAFEIKEEKQTCLTSIRDGRESLKKIIDCFSSTMPKLYEFENGELNDCSSFVDKLIEAKEGYYASKGLLGKILSIFSRAFGSIKDATYLKSKFDFLKETQITQENIANSLRNKLNSLEPIIKKKQSGPKIDTSDFEKLIKKYEEILTLFKTFSKENNEKHKEIIAHSLDFLEKLF